MGNPEDPPDPPPPELPALPETGLVVPLPLPPLPLLVLPKTPPLPPELPLPLVADLLPEELVALFAGPGPFEPEPPHPAPRIASKKTAAAGGVRAQLSPTRTWLPRVKIS
jgi:hypothetical protein